MILSPFHADLPQIRSCGQRLAATVTNAQVFEDGDQCLPPPVGTRAFSVACPRPPGGLNTGHLLRHKVIIIASLRDSELNVREASVGEVPGPMGEGMHGQEGLGWEG